MARDGFRFQRMKTIFPDRDARLFYGYWWSMDAITKALRERVVVEKDNLVLITGATGKGKSTFVGKLCFNYFEEMLNPRNEDEKMYTDEHYCINPEDYAKLMILHKGSVIWLDEARDAVSNRNWFSEINKTIIGRKNKNRKRGLTSFIVMPYENEVDKSFLKHVTLWIWVKKRGVCEIYCANNHRKGSSGLDIQAIIKREERWLKENPTKTLVIPTIHPEYIGRVRFGKFSEAEKKRYDRLVEEHQATGKLTDEEQQQMKPDKKELEAFVPKALDEMEAGAIKTKRELWDQLKEKTGFDDSTLVRHLNRHLKIRGYKTFSALEI